MCSVLKVLFYQTVSNGGISPGRKRKKDGNEMVSVHFLQTFPYSVHVSPLRSDANNSSDNG